jgi:hypothetical protein
VGGASVMTAPAPAARRDLVDHHVEAAPRAADVGQQRRLEPKTLKSFSYRPVYSVWGIANEMYRAVAE